MKRGVKIRNKFFLHSFIFIAAQITIDNCIEMVKEGVSDIVLLQSISSLPHKIYKALKEIEFNKKLLEKQTEKKDPLQTKFENAKEAILLANRDGQILSANPRF
jgi:PAS domain-containing protein